MGVERSDVLSMIFRRIDFNEETEDAIPDTSSQTSQLARMEFLQWLLLNFCIRTELTAYFKATKFLELACKFSGIELAFHGQLGRRTRFQEKSLPQLVVKVRNHSNTLNHIQVFSQQY